MRSSKPIFKIYKESPRNPNQHILPLYLSQQYNLLYPSEEKYDFFTLTVIITNSYSNTYHKMNEIEKPIDDTVIINIRPIIDKTDNLRMELYEEEAEAQDENKKSHCLVNANSKRAKERKIGYIIKKVYIWKKLYEGVEDKKGNRIKMTLQDAAEKVEISKKSLDEYLNQIKFGKYF